MRPFEPLGWLDVWSLQSWLYKNRSILKGDRGTRTFLVQENGVTNPELDKVPSLTILLRRAANLAAPLGLEIAKAELEQLDAHSVQHWETTEQTVAAHVCIVGNPACQLYAGPTVYFLAPGFVVAQDRQLRHSAINEGDTPRIHLLVHLTRAQPEYDIPLA